MLKTLLLATALTVSVPAFAQTMTPAPQSGPMAATPPSQTMGTAPATPMDQAAQPQTAQPQSAPVEQAAVAPASGAGPVVEAEFASYDKDSNGSLSKAEFSSCMVALNAANPNAKAKKPDAKWNNAAFAKADADKSKSVDKLELTGFLDGAANAS